MIFLFTDLMDLELNALEMAAVNDIYSKQKVNQAFWKETPQEFVSNFVRCLRACIPSGAIPSVVAAQAILESGWFSTDSLFGVKATKLQVSQCIGTVAKTQEIVNGTSVPTIGTFWENPSIQNNFANYLDYVARVKPNSAQFMPDNAEGYLAYLQNAPAYSTAADIFTNGVLTGGYRLSVLEVIRSNGLSAFDHN